MKEKKALTISSDFWRKSYFLSNSHSFLHCYADFGFKDKWTGFWKGQRKYLEYIAFKVDGCWLDGGSSRSFSYYGDCFEQTFSANGKEARLKCHMAEGEDAVVFEVECSEDAEFGIEAAFNIRERHENWTDREYTLNRDDGYIEIGNALGKCFITDLGKTLDFSGVYSFLKDHAPSGERQRCFVLQNMRGSGRKIRVALSAESKADWKLKPYCLKAKAQARSGDSEIDEAFYWASVGIELLSASSGKGRLYYAGLPWFTQFWGRDTFWSLPALLELGLNEDAKHALSEFSKNSSGGIIANFLPDNYNSIDATLLWIDALHRYLQKTGDKKFIMLQMPFLKKSVEALHRRTNESGFLAHDETVNETWMDSINRGSYAVDVQALYFNALGKAALVLGLERKKDTGLIGRCKGLSEMIMRNFSVFNENSFPADRVISFEPLQPEHKRRPNALVAVMLGLIRGKLAESVVESASSPEFYTGKGIRTLSSLDPAFGPAAYHNGASWSLPFAWLIASEFSLGKREDAVRHLKEYCKSMNEGALAGVPECWDSNSQAIIGCPLQLWSNAFVIRVVKEHLLDGKALKTGGKQAKVKKAGRGKAKGLAKKKLKVSP